jgi:hypothetical protein
LPDLPHCTADQAETNAPQSSGRKLTSAPARLPETVPMWSISLSIACIDRNDSEAATLPRLSLLVSEAYGTGRF